VSGYEISPESREEYDSLPRNEQWRAHRTLPAVDFFNDWTARYAKLVDMLVPNAINGPTTGTFRTRAKDRLTGARLAQETGPLEQWHPDVQGLVHSIEDDQVRQREEARWGHVAVSQNVHMGTHALIANSPHRRTSTTVSYETGGQIRSTKALAERRCSSWKNRHGRWRKQSWKRTILMLHYSMIEWQHMFPLT
jgi:hypothetical protein